MAAKERIKAGVIVTPIVLTGQIGAPDALLRLRGSGRVPAMLRKPATASFGAWPTLDGTHTVFSGRKRYADIRQWGNEIARRMEAAGEFPGLYKIADEAMLILRNCRDIAIENLHFEDCWPTAIYLDHCQRVSIRNCSFAGGTFAICARGGSTRDIVIENCFWQQDDKDAPKRSWEGEKSGPNGPAIWNEIAWQQIHGDKKDFDYRVNLKEDHRAYDGDFFRAWGIAGNVVIRGNHIRNAFNAIHTFGSESGMLAVPCQNVLIEGNLFLRIRDNTVEPETGAANWVVRHNRFVDNFRPFSIEGTSTGFMYIYGNLGWNVVRPGPPNGDGNTGASLFKFNRESASEGPVVFAFNSFVLMHDIAKKHGIERFDFVNNAIFQSDGSALFGKGWWSNANPHDEAKAFTRRWDELRIRFSGNVIHARLKSGDEASRHYPHDLRHAGYPLDPGEIGANPQFRRKPSATDPENADLRPADGSPLRGVSADLEIALPDGGKISIPPLLDAGAWQGEGLARLPKEFPFLDGMWGVATSPA